MTHIEQRGSTAAEWAADNTVLFPNELGWETDTGKAKLGKLGVPWNDLDYTRAEVDFDPVDWDLDQVDNTHDVDKVVSGPQQDALDVLESDLRTDLAPKASPAFTGNPTAPSPAAADDDTSIATTEWVRDAFAALLLAATPIGSIKITTVNTNPGTYLGGTWSAWGSGRVPVGVDAAQTEFDTVEETGGAKTHLHGLGDTGWAQITGSSIVAARRISIGAPNAYAETFRTTGTPDTPLAAQAQATPLDGNTENASSLPPYITCYMWKRTA